MEALLAREVQRVSYVDQRAEIRAEELTLGRCLTCPGDIDERLAESLEQWRAATAQEQGVAGNFVLRDLTLQAIAERRPTTEPALAEIPEFRAEKLARYADQILAIVADSTSDR